MSNRELITRYSNMESASEYSADELGQYRAVSALAVTSAILAFASPLAFVSPLLLVVPIAAGATALLALSRIAAAGSNIVGAGIARLALAIAIVVGVASVVRLRARDEIFIRQSAASAEQWLQLVSTLRVDDAVRMMTRRAASQLQPATITPQIAAAFDDSLVSGVFATEPLVRKLVELRGKNELDFRLVDSAIASAAGQVQVGLQFSAKSPGLEPVALSLSLEKSRNPKASTTWQVDAWQLLEASTGG